MNILTVILGIVFISGKLITAFVSQIISALVSQIISLLSGKWFYGI